MDVSLITAWWEFLKKLWPEFLGGWAAYWTHHAMHRVWGIHVFKLFKRKTTKEV